MRLPTTLLFNTPSIHPGFLRNLWLVAGLPGRRRLVLHRRAPLVLLVLLRSSPRLLPLQASLARRGRTARVRLPFPRPLEAPAAREEKEKVPERSQPDGTSLPLRVGGCLAPHWRRWQAIGAESWTVVMFPSRTLLLPFLTPRYRFRRTGQALLGLKPCGKRSRRCLPKEP